MSGPGNFTLFGVLLYQGTKTLFPSYIACFLTPESDAKSLVVDEPERRTCADEIVIKPRQGDVATL
jgi:hypothetical protein